MRGTPVTDAERASAKNGWPWIFRGDPEFKRRVTVQPLCEGSCFAQRLADGVCEMRGRWVCSFCGDGVEVKP